MLSDFVFYCRDSSQRDNHSPYKARIYVLWGELITTLVNFRTTNKDHINRYVHA